MLLSAHLKRLSGLPFKAFSLTWPFGPSQSSNRYVRMFEWCPLPRPCADPVAALVGRSWENLRCGSEEESGCKTCSLDV